MSLTDYKRKRQEQVCLKIRELHFKHIIEAIRHPAQKGLACNIYFQRAFRAGRQFLEGKSAYNHLSESLRELIQKLSELPEERQLEQLLLSQQQGDSLFLVAQRMLELGLCNSKDRRLPVLFCLQFIAKSKLLLERFLSNQLIDFAVQSFQSMDSESIMAASILVEFVFLQQRERKAVLLARGLAQAFVKAIGSSKDPFTDQLLIVLAGYLLKEFSRGQLQLVLGFLDSQLQIESETTRAKVCQSLTQLEHEVALIPEVYRRIRLGKVFALASSGSGYSDAAFRVLSMLLYMEEQFSEQFVRLNSAALVKVIEKSLAKTDYHSVLEGLYVLSNLLTSTYSHADFRVSFCWDQVGKMAASTDLNTRREVVTIMCNYVLTEPEGRRVLECLPWMRHIVQSLSLNEYHLTEIALKALIVFSQESEDKANFRAECEAYQIRCWLEPILQLPDQVLSNLAETLIQSLEADL